MLWKRKVTPLRVFYDSKQLTFGAEVGEARKIIDRLGHLPLAIDQAAAYLQRICKPLKTYLPVFEHNFELVMKKKPPKALWLYREDTVYTTWDVSYSAVQKMCPEAAEILVISSFLSNQNVPEDIFKHCAQPSSCTGKYSATNTHFPSATRSVVRHSSTD